VIFGFSMVLLWDQWQIHTGKPATFFPSAKEAKDTGAAKPADAAGTAAQQSAVPTAASATPNAATLPAQAPAAANATSPAESWIVVTTDVLKLSFDPVGGSLVKAELLTHRDGNDSHKNVVLLDDTAQHVYVAQSGLIASNPTTILPNHKTIMRFEGSKTLEAGQDQIQFAFVSENQGGIELTKRYTLKRGQYLLDVQHRVKNTGAQAQQPQIYLQLVRDNSKPKGESSFYSTFTGPAIYSEQKKIPKGRIRPDQRQQSRIRKILATGLRGHGSALLCQRLAAGRRHQTGDLCPQDRLKPVLGGHDRTPAQH